MHEGTGFATMTPSRWAPVLLAAMLAACGNSGTGVTTASVLGPEAASNANPVARHDPNARAIQVGATAARAAKCGYNFDPGRLKASFLAAEAQQGLAPDLIAKVEKTYDTTHGAVAKAVAGQGDYCTEGKTREIKADLNRHLAGDFNPPPPKKVVAGQSGGFFSDLFGGSDAPPEKFGADTYFDPTGRPKNARQ